MLYHLLTPLAKQHIFFNLFNYITFRAAGATVTALLVSFLLGPWLIRRLRLPTPVLIAATLSWIVAWLFIWAVPRALPEVWFWSIK